MNWLGIDIGGANIKVADGRGFAATYPFALWRKADQLEHELRRVISESPESDHLITTMTGELADCFESGFQSELQKIYVEGDRPVNQFHGVHDLQLAYKLGEFLGVDVQRVTATAIGDTREVQAIKEAVEEG